MDRVQTGDEFRLSDEGEAKTFKYETRTGTGSNVELSADVAERYDDIADELGDGGRKQLLEEAIALFGHWYDAPDKLKEQIREKGRAEGLEEALRLYATYRLGIRGNDEGKEETG